MKQKRVICRSHGPLSVGPQWKTPWEDVWIRFSGKPDHRRTYYYGPTLESRAELIVDLTIDRELQAKYAGCGDQELDGAWDEDVRRLESLLNALDANGIAGEFDSDTPSIYTSALGIDRREAERMLSWWLERKHGISNAKFVWKSTGCFVMPMALGDYSESSQLVDAVDPTVSNQPEPSTRASSDNVVDQTREESGT